MTPAPFDPCRQWLGIDAVELVDPRRVLGIAASETDPRAVLRAAEARLERLRAVAPGPFEAARRALLKRVEEAREAVLAQLSAAGRPVAPSGPLSMPPPPGGGPRKQPPTSARSPVVPRVPVVPQVPRPPASHPDAAAWPDDQASTDPGPAIQIRRPIVYRKRSTGSGVLLALIAVLAAAAGGLYWYKFRPDRGGRPGRNATAAVAERPAAEPADPGNGRPAERFGVPDRVVSTAAPPEPAAPRRRPPQPDPPERIAQVAPQPSPNRMSEQRIPSEPPPPSPGQPPPDPSPRAPASSPTATPPEDAERLDALLRDATTALRQADFAAATTAVKAAATVATSKPSRERVERWAELVTFAEGFADYRKQAVASVTPGVEFDIDGKKIIVVEIDDEKFVYRFAGKNRTTPRERIPGGILMAIVTGWFDEKPANDLFIGAYHATKEEPDLDKARDSWRKAEAGGADASGLLPLLDDPVLAAPE